MYISRQKKKENIVEYILYMWQIEDLIRAYSFDLVAIEKEIISQFDIDEDQKNEMLDWYDNLIQLMLNEKVEESGHIQALKNIVNELSKLHISLLDSEFNDDYRSEFEALLPYIKDLLQKVNTKDKSTIEILFETLYGILMLKLKHEEISTATNEATIRIATFMSLLANKYHKLENDENFII